MSEKQWRRKAASLRRQQTNKVATDEHTWQLFVEEQGLELDSYPSEETVVEFAVICAVKTEVQYCTPFLC